MADGQETRLHSVVAKAVTLDNLAAGLLPAEVVAIVPSSTLHCGSKSQRIAEMNGWPYALVVVCRTQTAHGAPTTPSPGWSSR